MFIPYGNNLYLAAAIKKHVKVPVATIGVLNDPEMMEEIIASGKAVVVEITIALLVDHELPRKVLMNRDDEILHCLRCFVYMAEKATTTTRRCAINPLIGREIVRIEIHRAIHPLNVMIDAAGPGGLRAAITAARRGHRVIPVEGKTVICAVGQKSRNTMDYLDAAPFVRCIGDCVRSSN